MATKKLQTVKEMTRQNRSRKINKIIHLIFFGVMALALSFWTLTPILRVHNIASIWCFLNPWDYITMATSLWLFLMFLVCLIKVIIRITDISECPKFEKKSKDTCVGDYEGFLEVVPGSYILCKNGGLEYTFNNPNNNDDDDWISIEGQELEGDIPIYVASKHSVWVTSEPEMIISRKMPKKPYGLQKVFNLNDNDL
jgi:hypothetical protein